MSLQPSGPASSAPTDPPDAERHLRLLASQVPGMVYRWTAVPQGQPRYTYVSEGSQALLGLSPAQILADSSLPGRLCHPEDLPLDLEQNPAQWYQDQISSRFRVVRPGRPVQWVHRSSVLLGAGADGVERLGLMLDVTLQQQAEQALRAQDDLWKLALDAVGDGVWDWHLDTGQEIFSRRLREIYGYADHEILDLSDELDRRTHPDDREQMLRDRQAHFDGQTSVYINEHRVQCKNGQWKWVLSRGVVIRRDAEGRPLRMVGTHTDISERKQAEALIWQQAHYDMLTGLPNRRMMYDRLEQEMRHCARAGLQLAVVFIDLDHFKDINDTLGHHHGDVLLVEAARRIRACIRASDTVARQGGDEFTLLLPLLDSGEPVAQIAQTILLALAQPFDLEGEQGHISASLGVTFYPEDADDVAGLLRNADQALYKAKEAGRNQFCFFTPHMQEAAHTRLRLTHGLAQALQSQQLRMVYQPIVALARGEVHRFEAFMRWQHPELGLLEPEVFLPVAESCGRINELGDWMFEQAATQLQQWQRQWSRDVQLCINRSAAQFHQGQALQDTWLRRLAQLGLPAHGLVVEITEELLVHPRPEVVRQLLALRDAGVAVLLDDFGAGYSSLHHLQQYDIDLIKIGRQFVGELRPHARSQALCKAMIAMAHALGLKVVADGVQTRQQFDWLQQAGCDYAQGPWIAPPLSPHELDAWMNQRVSG